MGSGEALPMRSTAPLSVVIPALDADALLPPCLAALEEGRCGGLVREVVVVDGGSRDGTRDIAASLGARIIEAPRGRGTQLAAGAAAARGDWLLFLHADTVLGPGWSRQVAAFVQQGENAGGGAAYFRLHLDDAGWRARTIERGVAWRCRRLGLPYGDQGLLIEAQFYRALGGFRSLPLMEDVDLARRIGRRRLSALDATATSSAARYRRDGYARRVLRNLCCLALYYLGVPPRLIVRLYA
jgi:rSAM/selenodomain-associated transferase 2